MKVLGKQYDGDWPEIPLALVERLERDFGPFIPNPDKPDRAIWMDAGAAQLVAVLRQQYNAQQGEEEGCCFHGY